jgi:hypothetical protein
MLAACAGSTGSVDPPALAPIDGRLMARPAGPAALPARPLTDRDVELYWSADRRHLAQCADQAGTLITQVRIRDALVAGHPAPKPPAPEPNR